MNVELEHLVVLQAQDLELARLRAELAEAPRRVKQAEASLLAGQKKFDEVRTSLANEEKLRRGQESEIASQGTKLERLRRSLNAATSAAQVAAFEHEIAFAQTAISKLEDEELASMERTEALEQQLKAADGTQRSAAEHLEGERARAAQRTVSHKAEIAGIEQQRTELRSHVEAQWLATYDRLSKTKGTAVAEALGTATQGKCSACQMAVRPQRWQDLTGHDHEDEIFVCEICGRMLFWDPRRDTPRAWAAGDRLQNAKTGQQGGKETGSPQ